MILNFNFPITNVAGRDMDVRASKALIGLLESAVTRDEKYLDKIDSWVNSLERNNEIELDRVDTKELKTLIIQSTTTLNFAKIQLKKYVQKRLDETDPDKKPARKKK